MKAHTDESDRGRRRPLHEGDVLGISETTSDGNQAFPKNRKDSHPDGIDVRKGTTGLEDVPQRPGATGIDMGGGGEGEDLDLEK
jgi:hypothetical protein